MKASELITALTAAINAVGDREMFIQTDWDYVGEVAALPEHPDNILLMASDLPGVNDGFRDARQFVLPSVGSSAGPTEGGEILVRGDDQGIENTGS